MRGTAMSLRAGLSGLVILLLAAAVVMEENTWGVNYPTPHICAITGSTVDIPCTFSYPTKINEKTTTVHSRWWFKESYGRYLDLKSDSDYRGRVEYLFSGKDCTLRITDLRKSDSAEYKFRFTTNQPEGLDTTSPGVTLSVTDLQVEVKRSGSYVALTCQNSCNTAFQSYIWNVNKQKINEEGSSLTVSYNENNKYSCGVRGHEDYLSAEVYAPTVCSVSKSPTREIRENSEVTLTCSCDGYPAPEYTWYKMNHPGRLSTESQHVFRSIQSSDSGRYYCWAKNDLGDWTSADIVIDVKYDPKPPTVSVSPSAEILEGTRVTLTCSSDADPPLTYTWYKENHPGHFSTESQHVFRSIQSSDSGRYYCGAENDLGAWTSTYTVIDVKYAPRQTSASVSPPGDVVEGSSVTLTCQSDANPAPAFTWYKKSGNQIPKHINKGHQLHLSSIKSSDSAEYSCEAMNKYGNESSSWIHINVKYAPKPPSVSVSPSVQVVEGTPVKLSCSSDANPAANYTWYKKNDHKPQSLDQNFTITDTRPQHSGTYVCLAQNERGRQNSTVDLTVLAGPQNSTMIYATASAVFIAVILVFVFVWITKKRTSEQSSRPGDRPDNSEQIQQTEQQDDLQYAIVNFTKTPDAAAVYSNITPNKPKRHNQRNEEDEGIVEYSTVKLNKARTEHSPHDEESAEDPALLYSTVNKAKKQHGRKNF